MTREDHLTQFLDAAGWGKAERHFLAGDASNRSYERLIGGPNANISVLMNAPPEKGEDVRPFLAVTEQLHTMGLSAPQIYAQDEEHGFLLLEDFGDGLVARLCNTNPTLEREMYERAVDVLVSVNKHPAPDTLPPYDSATYLREAQLLTNWYLPAAGVALTDPQNAEFDRLITQACAAIAPSKPVLTMRDYHSENLLWLAERKDVQAIGLLDYQDALAGHPAYDLVSLLQDARRDTSTALQTEMIGRFCAATEVSNSEFTLPYNTLGLQRNLKIMGIFVRLAVRDKKPHYLGHLVRVWGHVEKNLEQPELCELGSWVKRHVPPPTDDVCSAIRKAADAD